MTRSRFLLAKLGEGLNFSPMFFSTASLVDANGRRVRLSARPHTLYPARSCTYHAINETRLRGENRRLKPIMATRPLCRAS